MPLYALCKMSLKPLHSAPTTEKSRTCSFLTVEISKSACCRGEFGHNYEFNGSGRSVAWYARLLGVQEVVSSNLTAPTIYGENLIKQNLNRKKIFPPPNNRCFL